MFAEEKGNRTADCNILPVKKLERDWMKQKLTHDKMLN
jgi:hypothetical protein